MTTNIYIDAIKGSDATGDGTAQKPYKTLQYFCLNKAVRVSVNYTIYLKKGIYEITDGTIFGIFASGNITIIGKDKDTEVIQKVGMYPNSSGGNKDFTLTIAKLKYNIVKSLSNANLNSYKWNWNFYNVLIEYMPDNAYSVMYPIGSKTVFRNCVKLTSSTSMFRTTEGIVEVYDSIGYFTSGYSTSQTSWDKRGNTIGSIVNYEEVLKKGAYPWNINRTLILHNSEYKRYSEAKEEILSYKKINTNMTANISNGFEVTGTTSLGSLPLYYAFDGKLDTWYRTNDSPTADITLKLPEKKRIGKFNLANHPNGNPNKFELYASNNNTSWVKLTEGNFMATGTFKGEYTFDNKSEYQYYKLSILGVSGSYVYIVELEYFETIVEKEATEEGWDVVSSTIPSASMYIDNGMDTLSIFNRANVTLKSQKMTNKDEILNGEQGKVFSANIDLKKYFDIVSVRTEVKK